MNIAVRWVAKIARERKYKKKKQQQFQFVSELHDLMLITHVVGSLLYIYYRTFCSFAVCGTTYICEIEQKKLLKLLCPSPDGGKAIASWR